MSNISRIGAFIRQLDWRISFGLIVTFFWILAGVWFVTDAVRSQSGGDLGLAAMGSFLEGAFAPLAFLWLVLGLFIQQRELANNTEALRRTSEQSEKQTEAIAATEMNARQETFFKIAEDVKRQLGAITGMLLMSSVGPAGNGKYSREEMDEYFQQVSNGDFELFARQILTRDLLEEGGLPELFYGTEIRRKHCRNFRRTYDRLLKLAENCDVDGIIVDSLKQTAFGLLYQRMGKYLPR
jgi:hypothetical protein